MAFLLYLIISLICVYFLTSRSNGMKLKGQAVILKRLIFLTLILLILILFPLGTRKQLQLLERSANTELWYTANPNTSTFFGFTDRNNCKYSYCRNASSICRKTSSRIVYFVATEPKNAKRRHAIRGTWGSIETVHRPIFVMGISSQDSDMIAVLNEAEVYQDIIIENFIDTFENATLKTEAILKHYDKFCPNTKYLMKTEDDVFVNVDEVENIVRRHTGPGQINSHAPIIGYVSEYAKVVRNARSIWYVGHSMFFDRTYPAYTSRMGYLLPGNKIRQILFQSKSFPMIPVEDAFFTGIVASKIGLERKMDTSFNWQPLKVNNHCVIRTRSIIHTSDPLEMYKLWRSINDNHRMTCLTWFNKLMVKLFG